MFIAILYDKDTNLQFCYTPITEDNALETLWPMVELGLKEKLNLKKPFLKVEKTIGGVILWHEIKVKKMSKRAFISKLSTVFKKIEKTRIKRGIQDIAN